MLAHALARLRQRAAAPPLFVPAGTPGTPGTSSNGAAFPVPAAEDGAGTAGTPDRPGPAEPENVPTVPGPSAGLGTPETQQIRACPQRPRRPRENDDTGAASAERSREQSGLPRWPDLDALRQAYGEAKGIEAKRATVAAWAGAAGGRVGDGSLLLPADLPNTLTAATLRMYGRCVGLKVATFERRCRWCVNPAMPGDPLCEHCAWLSGRPLPPFVERERKVPFP